MLQPHSISSTPIEKLYLFPIGSLQCTEHAHITRLKLMRSMRGKAAGNDVICKTKLRDLEGLMRSKPIANQKAWPLTSTSLGLWVKDMLDPLQVDGAVCVSIL